LPTGSSCKCLTLPNAECSDELNDGVACVDKVAEVNNAYVSKLSPFNANKPTITRDCPKKLTRATPDEQAALCANLVPNYVKPDPCLTVSCLNGGSCVDGSCVCTSNYDGDLCENVIDLCANVNCGANGVCDSASGVCSCNSGFEGQFCEVDMCSTISCGAHGQCELGVCKCAASYSGANCNTKDPNFNFWDHYSTCPDPAGCFSIFQHGWFNGMEAKFPVGDFNVDSIGYLNNQMSSFKLPAGLKVQMFDGENFNGHSITVNGGMDADVAKLQSLGFSNDMLSSMKVYK